MRIHPKIEQFHAFCKLLFWRSYILPVDEDAEAAGRAPAWAPKKSRSFFVVRGRADVFQGRVDV